VPSSIQITLILEKIDAIALQKGKESHNNDVGKIFIKDEFITYYKSLT